MIDVVIYFIFQIVIIYLPLTIKKKVSRDNVLVWSTIWATVFTSECLSIILTIIALLSEGYQLEVIDYILSIMIILLMIANVPLIKFLNNKLIEKRNII